MRDSRLVAKQGIIVTIVLILAALVVWLPVGNQTSEPSPGGRVQTILDVSFTLPPHATNYFVSYPFTFPPPSLEATVEGNFTARQSGLEAAELFVLDGQELASLRTNGTSNLANLFDSGPTTGSAFTVPLFSPGTYYFVFIEEPFGTTHAAAGIDSGVAVKAIAEIAYSTCGVC